MAYGYCKEGMAVNWNGVPVDAIVRRNASIIKEIESHAEKSEHFKVLGGMSAFLAAGATRK